LAENGVGAVLNLRLLIDAEHHRLLRRMQVQPDYVADPALQLRIGAELERLLPPPGHTGGWVE
jgi:hypothetical protein